MQKAAHAGEWGEGQVGRIERHQVEVLSPSNKCPLEGLRLRLGLHEGAENDGQEVRPPPLELRQPGVQRHRTGQDVDWLATRQREIEWCFVVLRTLRGRLVVEVHFPLSPRHLLEQIPCRLPLLVQLD